MRLEAKGTVYQVLYTGCQNCSHRVWVSRSHSGGGREWDTWDRLKQVQFRWNVVLSLLFVF